ncbi:MAG: aminodeoxychorismate/anthranilate synthase component 2 [Gammaproteobacteria bacterium]|nr:aminodeoxychorismate/anthranilate synthase component 2 [Gammaproteobacteria bacterium]
MILFIDNYDSFVYNLARYVGELGFERLVKRNDQISLEEIKILSPSHIILSPGPGEPRQAGICMDVVRYFSAYIPILGVCLGHQAIAEVYGGRVTRAKHPMHGKASMITHLEKKLFKNIVNPLQAARYHSLIVSEENFPKELQITARCEKGEIMALEHLTLPVFGVQFHPESVLTQDGHLLLKNFLSGWSLNDYAKITT